MFEKFENWLEKDFPKDYRNYMIGFGSMTDLNYGQYWKTLSIFAQNCSYRPIVSLIFSDSYCTLHLDSKSLFGVDSYSDIINTDVMNQIMFRIEDITGKPISEQYE